MTHAGNLTGMLLWVVPAFQPCLTKAESMHAFELADSSGSPYLLKSGTRSRLTVVCFLGTECPLARLYGPRLSEIADEFTEQDVEFVGIDSNQQDSLADIQEYVKTRSIRFPILKDTDNRVADRYGATRTPEVFVLDQDLAIVYQGRIDDQYTPGVSRTHPGRRHLHQALSELLASSRVTVSRTKVTGCLIGRVSDRSHHYVGDVTYAEHVAPVLHRHCIECHRAGDIGPFSLEHFREVIGWAETMLEAIDDGRMPPWHADPAHGEFRNARHMSESDKQTLRDWVAGGMPPGNLSDVPELPPAVTGWQLVKEPDLILEMRDLAFDVAAEGTVEYQYFVVDPGFTDDKWILDAQTMPGNRSVVHHIIVFIRAPELSRPRDAGWLTAYVPGARQAKMPEGGARLVPAGSKFVFQMHYTPNGQEQTDLSKLGLVFANEQDVTHEVFTIAELEQEFEIPPRQSRHRVEREIGKLPKDAELLSITPHMHYRGRSFRLWKGHAEDEETLLHVPGYDFNWQHVYELARPLALNDVERLRFAMTFDNSDENPSNPDSSQWVTWGDQSWEEMAVAFFDISVPRGTTGNRNLSGRTDQTDTTNRRQRIESYVAHFFRTLDRNDDGTVAKTEVPIIVRRRFNRFDRDHNGYVTRDEIVETAEALFPPGRTN